ncbi:MAG: class I SAM-dependent methyltransferase [Rhodothermales bacterium]|nr:class I SAM-dependent methyltransferase [Rhodothermales bacterium]
MAHKVLDFVHRVAAHAIRSGDVAIDATAGNGHDTARLAQAVGSAGHVWAFDIQAKALRNTARRLGDLGLGERVTLVRETHARMVDYVPDGVRVAAFNLGYLPGGSRDLITRPGSTRHALTAAADLLLPGGLLIVVIYAGHPGGAAEKEAVDYWLDERVGSGWGVVRFGFSGKRGAPPEAVIVRRR